MVTILEKFIFLDKATLRSIPINIKLIISSIIFLAIFLLGLSSCSQFGNLPDGKHLQRIQESKHFSKEREQFVNRRPDILDKMRERMQSKSLWVYWFFGDDNDRSPKEKLPEIVPDIKSFLTISDHIKVIWLGHSTLLINLGGKIILLDPIFSGAASPVPFVVTRFQPPVIKLKDLPHIDYVVISHDHYDHLDRDTVRYFKDKKTLFLAPLGVGAHLRGWGINKQKITELDWWENVQLGGITFTATPAQHFSGRGLLARNKTLWAGWVLEKGPKKVFFSGDTGFDSHFKEIGERLGPFDLAFLDVAQYNLNWREVHLLPHQVPQAFFDVNAKFLIPIHWAMFEIAMHPWYEPAEKLKVNAREKGINLLTPKIGQMIELGKSQKTSFWWEALIKRN